jgi:hypothetical protein
MAAMFAVQCLEQSSGAAKIRYARPPDLVRSAALLVAPLESCATDAASPDGAHVSPCRIPDGGFARLPLRLPFTRQILQNRLSATTGMTSG